uniref:Uncharacterized protein n=1 Tax=Agrobacterium tumefaciens TaxID=358 RepID=A0A2Z2PRF3_AGRTU|nr:hypothetical protein [Agrobacterium tumefaciens]
MLPGRRAPPNDIFVQHSASGEGEGVKGGRNPLKTAEYERFFYPAPLVGLSPTMAYFNIISIVII